MPYLKIWIHLVWATKNHDPLLQDDEVRNKVFNHMREYALKKDIKADTIGGYFDHCHVLVSLRSDQNIATVVNLLKGESSFWVNKTKLTPSKFGWQDEYFATSISHSQVKAVRKYILNQETHHQTKTFAEEYRTFIDKYEF